MSGDYYKILGVPETAGDDEIKAAYKKLAMQYHPDRHSGNKAYEEKFKQISEAYQVLGDPKQRAEYDKMNRFRRSGFRNQASDIHMDFDFSDIFRNFGFATSRGTGSSGGFSAFYDDIPSEFFGRRSKQEQNGDLQSEIEIPFRKAIHGGSEEFQIVQGHSKTVRVQIPPGINNGEKIKLKGMGGKNGDLILTIRVKPDPVFSRKGNDIYREVRLNLAQMLLGSSIRVQTVYDGMVEIKIPADTRPGTILKAGGLGVRTKNGTGDFYIKVVPEFPEQLNKKQKELFEAFAKSCRMKW